ncbi:AraC family transcriptional regulator [Aureibaculum sp. 2210JD6-5]|uniref:AraC family transcriptional regulator n=1 Tax=Aureibaculum sp. 2210JD6-5 TaxID=3103957 RepID=UPI002AAD5AA0|nr:AraC family transcriptional regulator [Aureibaculum sp. 2210JD6-5]MDY7393994.1 AraC family transcriptional regulator [Aureibaculum sp. 2210JD6-5]
MKLHLLNRASSKDSSFTVTHNNFPNFLKIWHYHPELELVLILKSTGTLFVGDAIVNFKENDVVLIGENLPHMWLNDDVYFNQDSNLSSEAIAIHFNKFFLGEVFLNMPEMIQINNMINGASQGIKFYDLNQDLLKDIVNLKTLDPFARITGFINILHKLSKAKSENLVSSGFIKTFNKTENKTLDKVYEFIFNNFNQPITSKDVANVVKMNSSAFSRFFKRMHRKTFTGYLNELRIGYACKLLIEEKQNITSICYDCGYNNISNFNRQFRKIKGMSPSQYVKVHSK